MKIDIVKVIADARLSARHYQIVAIGFGVMIVDGYDLAAMAMAIPRLSRDWGVQPSELSLALSAVFVGVFFGSGTAGWLGDRIGRRTTLVGTLAVAGLGMSLTPLVQNPDQLAVARFITGAGAGGGIPVILAYTQEHMPDSSRNLFTALMYTGAGMGSVLGGLAGPSLLAIGDWQAIFVTGGVAAFAMIPVILIFLPESVRFLVGKGAPSQRVGPMLAKLNREFDPPEVATYELVEPNKPESSGAFAALFKRDLVYVTAFVWLVFVSNQFLVFYVASWMPTLLVGEDVAMDNALYILALFNLGGVVGGVLFGLFGDRLSPVRVLLATYSSAIVLLLMFAVAGTSLWLLSISATLAGAAIVGSSFLLGAFTPSLYPTKARSTGIGSALAVGRFGSIAAPLLGGYFLAQGLGMRDMMIAATIPALLCTLAIVGIKRQTAARITR
ncbi:MAG: MFS transporter [Pacificimonas sp.]|nr:MFS transporter [Pacificimonas sp.]